MRKRFLVALILLLLFSTYNIQNKFKINLGSTITEIQINNNEIVDEEIIYAKLSFLYNKNLFFLKTNDITKKLNEITFINSFEIKKIYPDKIKIKIFEQQPLVILQDKKKKYYYTIDGNIINFIYYKKFENLPIVFADKQSFKNFYSDLKKIKFSISDTKTIYFFEANRWDILTKKNKLIKLPIHNYLESLKNFNTLKELDKFDKYKIFDYRIKDQLILK